MAEPTLRPSPPVSTAHELAVLRQRVSDSAAFASRQAERIGDLERYVRVLHEAISRFELQRRAGDSAPSQEDVSRKHRTELGGKV